MRQSTRKTTLETSLHPPYASHRIFPHFQLLKRKPHYNESSLGQHFPSPQLSTLTASADNPSTGSLSRSPPLTSEL
ncbi:hypothetical protein TNCV_5111191 [Trichonephila clavipes]|nr:hypothetical protein TNCV_5111191 [Trichonephila clavipes]